MPPSKIRAIGLIIVGALAMISDFRMDSFHGDNAFGAVANALGSILLYGGLVLIVVGVTKLMEHNQSQDSGRVISMERRK